MANWYYTKNSVFLSSEKVVHWTFHVSFFWPPVQEAKGCLQRHRISQFFCLAKKSNCQQNVKSLLRRKWMLLGFIPPSNWTKVHYFCNSQKQTIYICCTAALLHCCSAVIKVRVMSIRSARNCQESNLGLLGEKRDRHLCALSPFCLSWWEQGFKPWSSENT